MRAQTFRCDDEGYIRHWAIVGPSKTPYTGPPDSDDGMRRRAADPAIVVPPADVAIGRPGPFGEKWRFYWPGWNAFVEQSAFYYQLEVLDLYAATHVHVPSQRTAPCRLWALGTADVWVNGEHLVRESVPKYMFPSATAVELPLREGANQLCVRLQALGVRDTRVLFGLQLLEGAEEARVTIPGEPRVTSQLAIAEQWLRSAKADGRDCVVAESPPPYSAAVRVAGESLVWPSDQERLGFDPANGFGLAVRVEVGQHTLERQLEVPANRPALSRGMGSLREHRREYVRRVAGRHSGGRDDAQGIIARHLGACPDPESDQRALGDALRFVRDRNDCADFALAALLRLYALEALSDTQKEQVRRTAIGFRYWSDEDGTDGMCFTSENHSLLFHGCQLVAGRLFPDEQFPASGRSGREQAEVGARRCREWLTTVESQNGFREFLSSTYMPITVAALMNLVDFAGDEELGRRAAAQVDKILRDLARHSFDGVTVAPQGRVYRGILYPETSSAHALLSYATTEAVIGHTGWAMFVASSPSYQPPEDLAQLMCEPESRRYDMGHVQICLEKTSGYMLSSIRIPRADGKAAHGRVAPGRPGYQEHIWHATLGRDCHVFVNHPGAGFDLTMSRPGYWYGNGILPRLSQDAAMLRAVYNIPEEHPVHFTHAHWPSDVFGCEEVTDHWAFGAHGDAYIALWCSEPLHRHDEVLTGRELRAWGRDVAWLCRCSDVTEHPSLDAFKAACHELAPTSDGDALRVRES